MFTTVPDKTSGDVFTEAMWDTYIRDNLNKGVVRPIAETTLGSAAASIVFSSISTDYTHLFAIYHARSDTAATSTPLQVRCNGDSGANYNSQIGKFLVTTFNSSEAFAGTSVGILEIAAASAIANKFGSGLVLFPNYQSAVHKNIFGLYASPLTDGTSGQQIGIGSAIWKNVAVVNSITFLPSAGNLITGSKITLYGMAS